MACAGSGGDGADARPARKVPPILSHGRRTRPPAAGAAETQAGSPVWSSPIDSPARPAAYALPAFSQQRRAMCRLPTLGTRITSSDLLPHILHVVAIAF